jgi:hypothetical protein
METATPPLPPLQLVVHHRRGEHVDAAVEQRV